MAIFIFLIVMVWLISMFLNLVCGIELETSRWISLALVFVGFIAFICWLMLSHKVKVLERAQNIAELRKQRLWKEYYSDWLRRNKKFVKQLDREMDREMARESDPVYLIEREYWDKDNTNSYYFSLSECRFIREVDRYGSPYVNSDDELVIPTRGERY